MIREFEFREFVILPCIPQAVERIPQAVERIPQAVERIPQAVKRIPQAVERIPQAVKRIPQAVKRIRQSLPDAREAGKDALWRWFTSDYLSTRVKKFPEGSAQTGLQRENDEFTKFEFTNQ